MSKVVNRRGKVFEIRKILNERKHDIALESDVLVEEAAVAAELEKAKQYYSACRIQGIVRGFLARVLFKELLNEYRALLTIQRVMRGKLGRIKWMRAYWMSISVVKSPEALQELVDRSILHRETKGMGTAWQEYFDPVSNAFWYYERKSKLSTWNCPVALQKNLVCHWSGFQAFGGLPSDPICRCIFDNVAEYQGHIMRAHKWYCIACETQNFSATFPFCQMCGNERSEEQQSGTEVLQEAINDLENRMAMFMVKEHSHVEKGGDKFILKDHVIKLSLEKMQRVRARKAELAAAAGSGDADGGSIEDSANASQSSSKTGQTSKTTSTSRSRKKKEVSKKKKLPGLAKRQSLEAEAASKKWDIEDGKRRTRMLKVTGCMLPLAPLFTEEGEEAPHLLYQSVEENQYAGLYNSVVSAAEAKVDEELGGMAGEIERFRDPITKGIIPKTLFESVTKVRERVEGEDQPGVNNDDIDSDDDDLLEEEMAKDRAAKTGSKGTVESKGDDGTIATHTTIDTQEELQDQDLLNDFIQDKNSAGEQHHKMLVCQRFLEGRCVKRSTCPLAHPGLRDDAELFYTRLPGKVRKVQYVCCCPRWNGNARTGCQDAGDCKLYHTYIRPSTRDIILRIYPKKVGETSKVLPSGAEITGELKANKLQGYGVMTWHTGATYTGDWKDDLRHGLGIYRTPQGTEYHGAWEDGKRHGFGCYVNAIGEEYIGEWVDGKMQGMGRFSSATGDVYTGMFKNHKYHGVGIFSRSNGDKFTGFFEDGMASGIGVLTLGTGEKYKGHFNRNFRHGKGVCLYPNGSQYSGDWYRGSPDGFGVFVAPNGERYIGQFGGGKKEGQGRYFFLDGSFYDGNFHKNLAEGFGVYYFASGDKYAGNWQRDKRNGRGTYKYANGSVYTGNWVDNNIDGKGKFDWAYGAHYRGEFKKNSKHGRGIFTWPNGNCYKGQFEYERICGVGEMTYATGHRYKGHWKDNKKHGKGTFYFVSGAQYVGDWVEDEKHGKGKQTFMPDTFLEESYDGDWVYGVKHGQGIYTFRKDEGTIYEGAWAKDRRTGKGKITYKDGSYYRGDFVEEQMHGKGVYIGADASQYEGEWERNMRHGTGTHLDSDGSIYHGEYFNNMKHGRGKLQYPDGNIYEGVWEGNVIVGNGLVGTYTMNIGPTTRGGPEEVNIKCFPY